MYIITLVVHVRYNTSSHTADRWLVSFVILVIHYNANSCAAGQ